MTTRLLLILYFVEIIGFFAIGTLVALRQKTAMYRNFSTFAFSLGVWQLLQFLAQLLSVDHHGAAVDLLRASVVTSGIMATAFVVFALSYAGHKVRLLWFYAAGLLAGASTLFSSNLRAVEITYTGIGVPKLDAWYAVVLIYAAGCIFAGFIAIFLHFLKTNNKKERSRDKIILLTSLTVGTFVLLASFYTSEFSHTTWAQHIIPSACLVAMVSFLYAIIYRGLFDIHFFVLRAAAYVSTLLFMTIVFVAPVVLIFMYVLNMDIRPVPFVLIVLAAVAIFYTLQYLRQLFEKATNKIFFRNYYDPQDVLDRLTNVIVHTVEPRVLREETSKVLLNAIRPEFVKYILSDAHSNDKHITNFVKQLASISQANIIVADELDARKDAPLLHKLREQKIAVAVKLRTTHEDLGFLILGYKESGEVYSANDKRLLGIAADEIAIALQNALRFEEIALFNVTLQEKIEDATRRLRASNAKLKQLDQTKDDFISMASHQLRTPLTSIKGYVSMVLDGDAGPVTSQQKKMLNQAFISSQRMVYLISDLLNVSRLKTGKFIIEPVQTNLSKVIQDEVEQLQETAKGRNLTLTYNKPQHFPTLMLDETKLRQVIMNFMDNAIYYTPQGGNITVNLVDKPLSIEFTVTDDGIGVPKHEQHHLFSKFYRAHNAKRARPDGTGLGLFMAKKVIVAQGGAIIFRSKEGHGSTFGFTFAKEKVSAAPEKQIVVTHDD